MNSVPGSFWEWVALLDSGERTGLMLMCIFGFVFIVTFLLATIYKIHKNRLEDSLEARAVGPRYVGRRDSHGNTCQADTKPQAGHEFEHGGHFAMNLTSFTHAILAFQDGSAWSTALDGIDADKRFVLLIVGIGCGTGIILGTLGILSSAITSVVSPPRGNGFEARHDRSRHECRRDRQGHRIGHAAGGRHAAADRVLGEKEAGLTGVASDKATLSRMESEQPDDNKSQRRGRRLRHA